MCGIRDKGLLIGDLHTITSVFLPKGIFKFKRKKKNEVNVLKAGVLGEISIQLNRHRCISFMFI